VIKTTGNVLLDGCVYRNNSVLVAVFLLGSVDLISTLNIASSVIYEGQIWGDNYAAFTTTNSSYFGNTINGMNRLESQDSTFMNVELTITYCQRVMFERSEMVDSSLVVGSLSYQPCSEDRVISNTVFKNTPISLEFSTAVFRNSLLYPTQVLDC